MPEWNLNDLYPGMDSPEFAADLARGEAECKAFADAYRGKLDAILKGKEPGQALYEAIRALRGAGGSARPHHLLCRASSMRATRPTRKRAKFYGDAQERLTAASSDLLFFQLELNRLDDAALDAALRRAPLGHFRPWLEDIRKEKPYQLDDKIEQLFHEKSVTGRAAWNRLFDETISSLKFNVDGEELTLEPTLNKLQDTDGDVRQAASEALGDDAERQSPHLHADHQHARQGQGDRPTAGAASRTWPTSRHLSNRVEREVVDALVAAVREAYPRLSHRYYKLKAKWFGVDALNHWDRNAPLPKVEQRTIPWDEARDTVLDAYGGFSPEHGRYRAALLRRATGSTRRCGPARRRAPSRTRPCRPPIPMCCSTTRASRAT